MTEQLALYYNGFIILLTQVIHKKKIIIKKIFLILQYSTLESIGTSYITIAFMLAF